MQKREEGTERLEECRKRRRNLNIGRMQEEKKELKDWKNAGREEGSERLEECRKEKKELKDWKNAEKRRRN